MKSIHRAGRQSGFVDLGISLVVIALAGGVAYGVEHEAEVAPAQSTQEMPLQTDASEKNVSQNALQ